MKATPCVFIMGTQEDPHVSRVTSILQTQHGVHVETLDYLNKATFTYSFTEKGDLRFTINKTLVQEKFVIWDREKVIPGTPWYPKGVDQSVSNWNATEWIALFELISALHPERVVNSLDSKRCMLKPYQQQIATSVGFTIPNTLVSNHKPDALSFIQSVNNRAIMKSLSNGLYRTIKENNEEFYTKVMTIRIDPEELVQAPEEDILACPHFFQEEIQKAYELRVVVIDDVIFPFKINSQSNSMTELDWRRNIGDLDFELIEISAALRNKILQFQQKMGLFSGSLDLIVSKNGDEYFLECNQDGAWAWLDNIVNGEIAQVFAAKLLERAGYAN